MIINIHIETPDDYAQARRIRNQFINQGYSPAIIKVTRNETRVLGLTPLELAILEQLSLLKNTKEVGEALNYADGTIRNYIHGLLNKLGVRSQAEALTLYSKAKHSEVIIDS